MPQYEFRCETCQRMFSKLQTLDEHDHEKPVCPHCGSRRMEQTYSTFFAVTSKKSA
jgi:putative FmdB family regulatory protein